MLRVDNATKRYGKTVAVDGVSFEAQPGRILGLLGPNGAGKTSTIRMIAYITVPDEGRITFDGREVGPWSQQRMGYLPEERGLYKRMKVGEQLEYLAQLKGLRAHAARLEIKRWLERFDAANWYGKKVEELSKGMQQKIQFIATVVHQPDLLIFDEPFSGLDPINAELHQTVILELRDAGRTILFASHRMEQVEQICDDICMINEGAIVLSGSVHDVKKSFGRDTVVLEFNGEPDFLRELEARGRIRVSALANNHAEVRLLDGTSARDILDVATSRFDELYRFEQVAPSLNEIFISVITHERATGKTPSRHA